MLERVSTGTRQYSPFPPLQDLFDTLNYVISLTNEEIKRKIWLSTTLGSTSSWGSVSYLFTDFTFSQFVKSWVSMEHDANWMPKVSKRKRRM